MSRRKLGVSTLAIHGNPTRRSDKEPISKPIYQSATFANAVGSTDEVLYTRYGNNPNPVEIARKLAALPSRVRSQ